MNIKEELLEILSEIKPDFIFEGKTDLARSGELDSFDIISLVSEIDDRLEIKIPVEEIVPENFDSVEAMLNLIHSLN